MDSIKTPADELFEVLQAHKSQYGQQWPVSTPASTNGYAPEAQVESKTKRAIEAFKRIWS